MLTHSYNQNSAPPIGTTSTESGSPARAELKTFIATTRRELQALSLTLTQTLTQTLNEAAAPAAPPASPALPTESADPLHVEAAEPAHEQAVASPPPDETVAPEYHTLPATDSPTANNTDPVSAADPLARLNAIKLRLAQQIQNAS